MMTVKELIAELQAYQDHDYQVFVYDRESGYPMEIAGVDRTMGDRCDINTNQSE